MKQHANAVILYDLENLLPYHAIQHATSFNDFSLREINDLTTSNERVQKVLDGVAVRRAYTNWSDPKLKILRNEVLELGVTPVQIFGMGKAAQKNVADIQLTIDAMELCFTRADLDVFIIVSGDGGYGSLYNKLHERGKFVIAASYAENASPVVRAVADVFIELPMPASIRFANNLRIGAEEVMAKLNRGNYTDAATKEGSAPATAEEATAEFAEAVEANADALVLAAAEPQALPEGAMEMPDGQAPTDEAASDAGTEAATEAEQAPAKGKAAPAPTPGKGKPTGGVERFGAEPAAAPAKGGKPLDKAEAARPVPAVPLMEPASIVDAVSKEVRTYYLSYRDNRKIALDKAREVVGWLERHADHIAGFEERGIDLSLLGLAFGRVIVKFDHTIFYFDKFVDFARYIFAGSRFAVFTQHSAQYPYTPMAPRLGDKTMVLQGYEARPAMTAEERHTYDAYRTVLMTNIPILRWDNTTKVLEIARATAQLDPTPRPLADMIEMVHDKLQHHTSESVKFALLLLNGAQMIDRTPAGLPLIEQKLSLKPRYAKESAVLEGLQSAARKKITDVLGEVNEEVFEGLFRR